MMIFQSQLVLIFVFSISTSGIQCVQVRYRKFDAGKTVKDVPFHQYKADHVARCFSACIYLQNCMTFDHTITDNFTSDTSTTCKFYNNITTENTSLKNDSNVQLYSVMPRDCVEWYQAGYRMNAVYEIYIGNSQPVVQVFCDMQKEGGGWIVFQRRFNGSVSFEQNWESYKTGFGSKLGEHWLGNEIVSLITNLETQELYIEVSSFDGEIQSCKYQWFNISGEQDNYTLTYSETTGDPLKSSFTRFATKDHDNINNCAEKYKSGWWHHSCYTSNFNGPYSNTANPVGHAMGIIWTNHTRTYKTSVMMMRRKDWCPPSQHTIYF